MPTEITSSNPFTAKDSAGVIQKIKVIELPGSEEPAKIAGYAYVELTGSSYTVISGSENKLQEISSSLEKLNLLEDISSSVSNLATITSLASDISSSVSSLDITELSKLTPISSSISDISSSMQIVVDGMNHVTASVDNNTTYVEQLLRFNRATHVYSKIFNKTELYEEDESPKQIDLHTVPDLNPSTDTLIDLENYISKAIEVVIQNSTNKSVFLKVSYDPSESVSETNYTVKIPPGVIYNSESKIAHMRHKISFAGSSYPSMYGEVAANIVYNTNLNHDLSVGETFMGQAFVTSIATNYFIIPFNAGIPSVIAEWNFDDVSGFDSMKISGQARVAQSGQTLTLYVVQQPDNTPLASLTVPITSTTPVRFDLAFTPLNVTLTPGNYELLAEFTGTGGGELGDARVLFADLIKYTAP